MNKRLLKYLMLIVSLMLCIVLAGCDDVSDTITDDDTTTDATDERNYYIATFSFILASSTTLSEGS